MRGWAFNQINTVNKVMCFNCVCFFFLFFNQQIGCFMGFSIAGCVLSGAMFICYCITLAHYSQMKAYCSNRYYNNDYSRFYNYRDCYTRYNFRRDTAANVAGLGSCLLIFSLVEFFLALASSIYCCMAVCCCTSPGVVNTVSNITSTVSLIL